MTSFFPGTAANPYTEVELTISCRNLRNMDFFSKSDPMCVVSVKTLAGEWQEICRTEVICNNLNPNFAKKVVLEYHFEEQQFLKFDLYDIDSNNLSNLKEHDYLGHVTVSLGQIVSNGKLSLPIGGSTESNLGDIIITAEELSSNTDEVTLAFRAKHLKHKWYNWMNSYFEVHKVDENSELNLVYRSEIVKRTENPRWNRFTIPIRNLCGADFDRNICLSVWRWNLIKSPQLIGECYMTLRVLSSGPGTVNVFPIVHPKKINSPSGVIELVEYNLLKGFTFLEYILGGLQIHCTVAIDFTASNGNPNFEDSLHYIHGSTPNQYEQALLGVVSIIEDYDSDKLFPVLGFGAKVPPQGQVSHEFFVNLHPTNPYCLGVQGVIDAYKSCILQVQLYGPTNFSPVIKHVSNYAKTYQDGSQYFVLLIITDGVITDMPQTKQAIIAASNLPLSIIIVGVGFADFSAMNELDADVIPLSYNGVQASRDIVQFVPFRNFENFKSSATVRQALAKEVLFEIPNQVVGFMRSKGLEPKPKNFDSMAHVPVESPPPYTN